MTVGEDISVIGFDDTSWPAEEPSLTTFREPCRKMGAVAAQMLIDRILHPQKQHLAREQRQANPEKKG